MASNPPKLVVEIGTAGGGTVWAWSQIATDDAMVIGVDIEPREFEVGPDQTFVSVGGDSTAPETIERVMGLLYGNQPDFTFIDGDHSDETVRSDLQHYRGRITAIHDIVWPLGDLWKSLRAPDAVEVLVEPDGDDGWGPWGGIGVLL